MVHCTWRDCFASLAMTADMSSLNARRRHCEERAARRSNLCDPDGHRILAKRTRDTFWRNEPEPRIDEARRLLSPHPEEPRAARRLEGWRRPPLQPTLRDARRWRAPQGR